MYPEVIVSWLRNPQLFHHTTHKKLKSQVASDAADLIEQLVDRVESLQRIVDELRASHG